MGNLLKSELFKLRKDRSFWTLIFILAGAAIFWPIFLYFDNGPKSNTGIAMYVGSFEGNFYVTKIAPCILAGFFISSEYATGTMKSLAAIGHSRTRIFFSKLIAFSVGAIIISLVYLVVITIVGTLLFGLGDMSQISELSYIARTIGLLILYSAAFASIMALFSIILTESGKSIAVLILFFLLFDGLLFALSGYISFFKPIFNYSVFKLLLDIAKLDFGTGELLKLIIVPILTYVVFGMLGSIVFRRKEIK